MQSKKCVLVYYILAVSPVQKPNLLSTFITIKYQQHLDHHLSYHHYYCCSCFCHIIIVIYVPTFIFTLTNVTMSSFRKKVYRARKKLTAIDWNYHSDLPYATNEDAETLITRKYNQRTKSWDVRTVKMAKDYGYIWILMARIFKLWVDDDDSITWEVPMEADNPRLIAPTIAECEPLSPHEILARRKSKFSQASSS